LFTELKLQNFLVDVIDMICLKVIKKITSRSVEKSFPLKKNIVSNSSTLQNWYQQMENQYLVRRGRGVQVP
jgi:hypothetical protein